MGVIRRRRAMRPTGGGLASLAIALAVVVTGCVATPTRNLRVIEGGGSRSNPTPIPTQTTMPEPPNGVIFLGRIVLPCGQGPHCEPFARLVPVSIPGMAYGTGRGYAPAPDVVPLSLTSAPPGRATLGRLVGRSALDHEPEDRVATIPAGLWRIEVYGSDPAAAGGADALACVLDFTVHPQQWTGLHVAFQSGSACRIALSDRPFD